MKRPTHAGRWVLLLLVIIVLPVFILHPVQVVLAIGAGLLLLAAWNIVFGSPDRK